MNQRPLRRPVFTWVYSCLAVVGCLAPLAGCQSGSPGTWLTWKNPFASKGSAPPAQEVAPAYDSGLSADTEREQRRMPVVRTEAKTPERELGVAVREGKKKEAARIEAGAEFAQEMARARNLERSGKFPEARSVYQRLIARYPDRYEPYHRLGVVADHERRFGEAQALFSEAIRLNPRNPDLHNDLGFCLFLQGQYDKAEPALAHAVQLDPANPRYRNNLGMVLGRQRRDNEALEQFRRGGSEADAYYNLAFVLAAREDTEDAKKYFHMALRADPGYEQARQAIDKLDHDAANRQAPSGSETANAPVWKTGRDENVQAPPRYDTRPASLTVPVTSVLGNEPRDPALIR